MATKDGPVAIETLRTGDLVFARDEETGAPGWHEVTALMGREAPGLVWITTVDAAGKHAQLGVTPEHPLYVADLGWTDAGEVAAGDA